MYNARFRAYLTLLYSILFVLGSFHTTYAAFYTTKARTAALAEPVATNRQNGQSAIQANKVHGIPVFSAVTNSLLRPDTAPGDSYKGLLALIFGGAGIALTILAFSVPSVIGLVVPAFFSGVAGIVFGAMRKNSNKRMGRVGLVLGIITVAVITLFVAAVFIALASFT